MSNPTYRTMIEAGYVRHLTSEEALREAAACQNYITISDAAAATIAAGWQSPTGHGASMAALACGCPMAVKNLHAAIADAHRELDARPPEDEETAENRLMLSALAAWADFGPGQHLTAPDADAVADADAEAARLHAWVITRSSGGCLPDAEPHAIVATRSEAISIFWDEVTDWADEDDDNVYERWVALDESYDLEMSTRATVDAIRADGDAGRGKHTFPSFQVATNDDEVVVWELHREEPPF